MDAARTQDTVRMQPNEETTHNWHGQDSPVVLVTPVSQSLENRNFKKKENKRTKLVDGRMGGEESQSAPDAAPAQQEGVTTTPAYGKDWTMNSFPSF